MFCRTWYLSNLFAVHHTIILLFNVESKIFVTMATRSLVINLSKITKRLVIAKVSNRFKQIVVAESDVIIRI